MAPPVSYDIDNWDELDFYIRAHRACSILAQKGFCTIRSSLDKSVKQAVHREARRSRKECTFTRVPQEALSSLFGDTASCWTKELPDPADGPGPPEEACFMQVDHELEEIGRCIAAASRQHFQLGLEGRWAGVLHHSRMPEDRPAPPLIDADEGTEYITRAIRKKVTLLHFLGPSSVRLCILPRKEREKAYEATLKEDAIIAYRNDVCTLSYATRGLALSLQVDFVAESRKGLQEGPKDLLPMSQDLEDWYTSRLLQAAERDPSDDVPDDFLREAKLSFCCGNPVQIRDLWFHLPSLPAPAESGLTQLQAVVLSGQDVVTEIAPLDESAVPFPRAMRAQFPGKWDLSEYYDEDPTRAGDFKMYTRHLSVLRDDYSDPVDLHAFGVTAMEDATLDMRARMLYQAHWSCIRKSSLENVQGQDIGFFAGLSGQNFSSFLGKKAKINRFTMMGLSQPATVSRLAYYFNSRGPSMAIDTEDSAGSVALDAAVQNLLQQGPHGPCAFASAASYIDGPFETIMQCAAGVLSTSGRSRVFDESSDGFVKGEGVVCLLLQPGLDQEEGRPAVVGSAVNSKGLSSALAAPSGPALRDVIVKAARDASVPCNLLDAVEVSAGGGLLQDLIELGALAEALQSVDRSPHAVPVRAVKSSYGSLGTPSGLVAVVRVSALLERGLHGPGLHLRQLVDAQGVLGDEEGRDRLLFLTEVAEAGHPNQLVGVSSFGLTGTNVHQVIWGSVHEYRSVPGGEPITWWPAAEVQAARQPVMGYFVVGTMNNWTEPLLMEEEGEGVYGHTLIMGDNNWECFQIWLDRDEGQVLHPGRPRASMDAQIRGPEMDVARDYCWCISGMTRTVLLINEEQAKERQEEDQRANKEGRIPPSRTQPVRVVYPGNTLPEGYQHATKAEEMPSALLNRESAGRPGDKYRLRLYVRGRYRRLEWSRAVGLDAITLPEEEPFLHRYAIIGDHSYWCFEPMTPDPADPAAHVAEVVLLKGRSRFQIYRDSDWEQGFYPASPLADCEGKILGPDEYAPGKEWLLKGEVGDVFRIEFRREVAQDGERRSLRWEHVRSTEVDFEQLAGAHEYFLVGTWSDFRQLDRMDYDAETQTYRRGARIGESGQESFQILLNSNWLSAVHPSINDASVFTDDGHTLMGPDDDGADKYWTVGLVPDENTATGSLLTVFMKMSGGHPHKVWWEVEDDKMTHQLKLALSCRRIFERHCRLMGIQQDITPYTKEQMKTAKIPKLNDNWAGKDLDDLMEKLEREGLTEKLLAQQVGQAKEGT